MNVFGKLFEDYLVVIKPLTPSQDQLLGVESIRKGAIKNSDLLRQTADLSKFPFMFDQSIVHWLVNVCRHIEAGLTFSKDELLKLENMYLRIKNGITKKQASAAVTKYLERWAAEVKSLYGEPDEYSQFKHVSSGKILNWVEYQSKSDKSEFVRLINKIDLSNADFFRMDIQRLFSFLNLIGLADASDEDKNTLIDSVIRERGVGREDLGYYQKQEILNSKDFWWFYLVPRNAVFGF